MFDTIKKLIQPEQAQASELDKKRAELAQRKNLLAAGAERRRQLATVTAQASAARARAYADLDAIINDPMRNSTASEDETAAARLALVSATKAEAEAIAAEHAYRAECGDLDAQAQAIGNEQALLDAAGFAERFEEAAAPFLQWAVGGLALEAAMHDVVADALKRFPADTLDGRVRRAAGLPPLEFPPGVFRKSTAPDGGGRSMLFDSILFTAGIFCPHLLPESIAASVLNAVQRWRERGSGVLLVPRHAVWLQVGGNRLGDLTEGDEIALLRGRVRLDAHGHTL
jgi:hypothetical protein